ncbi:PHP domain-containing protein [Flagellimonas sp.]|uniref:PHP domain-containing protein n=1 Tax=Flagellimonas sp. TaxID=2058762 RepID=UPI003B5222EB
MKKIDLHLHTKPSLSDSDFVFSLSKLKEYVNSLAIDCIAITNHNLFDLEQFNSIKEELSIKVLPGIEINLEKGHLLLISEDSELEDFESKCNKVALSISNQHDFISVQNLKEVFVDLNRYLLIPHYDKKPIIRPEIIEELKDFISSGEVTSAKKFKYCINDAESLTPVLFSDLRFKEDMTEFSPRQTYIDIDDTSLKAIKTCLLDKEKVFLVREDGHTFFQVFENGQKLSTGLNVVLGERSSGKSFTLKRIFNDYENVKYIKQFELLETDEEKDKKRFNDLLTIKKSSVSELYLKEFKSVLDEILKIDRIENEKSVENYLDTLLRVASEEEKKDIYSKCSLFNESKYLETDNDILKQLISSTKLLIENIEYRAIIDKHITKELLVSLLLELIQKYNQEEELNQKKLWINSILSNIKSELKSNTASISIEDIDFYKTLLDLKRLDKFQKLVGFVKTERVIEQSDVRRFKIVASTKRFNGAQELLNKSGRKTIFKDAFEVYDSPIEYLDELRKISVLPETEYYKYFVDVEYKILNEHGIEVSGGERSEFNLLEKIQNAHHYDLLLIDEPESSFDNLFLKNEVNEQIKSIAKSVPVIIVTHNNTVGASIKPDYVLYTKKEVVDKKASFKIFSGFPSDTKLKTVDGEEISNYDIMLNCLEAGDLAYTQRGKSYEILKN